MRILSISAHLDDTEIACGGVLAKAVANGAECKIICVSNSAYTDLSGKVMRTQSQALEEGREAAAILGIRDLVVLDFPTKDIPEHSSVVEALEDEMRRFKPDVILTHWPFDTHADHRHTALGSFAAARRLRSILMYEPIAPAGRSFVGFRPQVYVDISEHVETKFRALKAHKSQAEKFGEDWLRAIHARGVLRGWDIGCAHAEAFEALRFEWLL